MKRTARHSAESTALCLILCCTFASQCFANSDDRADPLLRYRTIGGMQGMYEVREAARKFLLRQRAPAQGTWIALLPDVRIFVPTCAVPLRTRWAVASDQAPDMRGVMVSCPQSTAKHYKQWGAFVGVGTSPKRGAQ